MSDAPHTVEEAWSLVLANVTAANAIDRPAFSLAGKEASQRSLRVQQLAGLYLIQMLKYHLYQSSGQVPSIANLDAIADRLWSGYATLLPGNDPTLLVETLRT